LQFEVSSEMENEGENVKASGLIHSSLPQLVDMKAPSAEQTLSHSLARPTTNVEDQSSCRFDD
jgi:hypothetical protein